MNRIHYKTGRRGREEVRTRGPVRVLRHEEFQQRTGVLAIANVSRHAEAATCRVSLYRDEDGGVLEVDDDGRGFDPATGTGTGQGLRNLEERAEGLGGRAEIHSAPGQGTRVRITIPR